MNLHYHMPSERIYEEHLKTIDGVKFTRREVDVIACLLNGRYVKSIASLLSFSPRTAEAHIHNIASKLNCNSREGIINFVEKSGKVFWMHMYYLEMIGQPIPENLDPIMPTAFIREETPFVKSYFHKFLKLLQYKRYLLAVASLILFGFCLWTLMLRKEGTLFPVSKESSVRSELETPGNSVFLDRPGIIKKIDKKLKSCQEVDRVSLVGIVGVGGAGKTTLARQFGLMQDASVVWEINAETKERLMNSFKELASKLAKTKEQKEEIGFIDFIENPEEKEIQLLFLVRNWLREKPNWILIYDNVEDLVEMKSYFPKDVKVWGNGKVIITTRDKNIENAAYIKPENIVNVEALSDDEKLILFSKIIFNCTPDKLSQNQRDEAISFLKNIPSFPLDVTIAGHYIKNNQITFDQYLEKILKYKVQSSLIKEIISYSKTRDKIIILSLKKMITKIPKFKEFLFLIFLLDSQDIPKDLLNFYKNKVLVDIFIHYLKKNSLISINKNNDIITFSFHRSTQLIGFDFLATLLSEQEKEQYFKNAISAIQAFLKKDCKNAALLKHHIESLLKHIPETKLRKEIMELNQAVKKCTSE